MKEKCDLM